jgi:hypothetical protein
MTKKISEIQFPISNKDGFISKMNKQKMKTMFGQQQERKSEK